MELCSFFTSLHIGACRKKIYNKKSVTKCFFDHWEVRLYTFQMRRSVLLLLFGAIAWYGNAQYKPNYQFAVGIRAGSEAATCGLTLKAKLSNHAAIEGLIGYTNKGLAGTLLYQHHFKLLDIPTFHGYAGAGMHYTAHTGYDNYISRTSRELTYQNGGRAYGLDAVVGLEYKFPSCPIAVSIDLKPYFEWVQLNSYNKGIDKSIGVKLAF